MNNLLSNFNTLFYNNGIENIKNRIKKKCPGNFLEFSVCFVVKNDSKKN